MLRELRIKANMTQAELAERLQVTQSAVSTWEKGQRFPRKDKLHELCKLLNCKVDDLL